MSRMSSRIPVFCQGPYVHFIIQPYAKTWTKAGRKEFPWAARIIENNVITCAGTLVDVRWVLTLATCVIDR